MDRNHMQKILTEKIALLTLAVHKIIVVDRIIILRLVKSINTSCVIVSLQSDSGLQTIDFADQL